MLVAVFKCLTLSMSEPGHECLSRECLFPPLHDGKDEVLLTFLLQTDISPVADISTQTPCLFALCESSQNREPVHFEAMTSFSLQISFSPLVEELCFDFFVDVEANKVLILVVFVNKVHSMAIPLSQ